MTRTPSRTVKAYLGGCRGHRYERTGTTQASGWLTRLRSTRVRPLVLRPLQPHCEQPLKTLGPDEWSVE